MSAAAQAKTYAEGLGLTVVEKPVSSQEEFQQAADELCGQADAILTASDNLAAASAEAIAQAASAAGKPWYAHGDCQLVQQGALAGVSVDLRRGGQSSAPTWPCRSWPAGRWAELPVHFFSQPEVYLNLAAQQAPGPGGNFPAGGPGHRPVLQLNNKIFPAPEGSPGHFFCFFLPRFPPPCFDIS